MTAVQPTAGLANSTPGLVSAGGVAETVILAAGSSWLAVLDRTASSRDPRGPSGFAAGS